MCVCLMLTDAELDGIADAIDPLLLFFTIVAPQLLFSHLRKDQSLRFYRAAGAGLGNVYLWQWLDNQFRFWPSLGLDYSTHTAFAVTLIVSLSVLRRNWLWGLVPLLLVYAMLMKYLHYHTLLDMITTALIIMPFTYFIHKVNE